MDPLECALDTAKRMRESLQAELEEARSQRILIRQLDVQGLFERARRRGEFNVRLAQMQETLAVALAEVATRLGIPRVTAEVLAGLHGALAESVATALSELRASAQALAELDGMNQTLAKRALACVRGYLGALSPRGSAYDRSGAISNHGVVSITRQVA